ncbi:hypothetical protein PFICI_10694 [Pestalotiopsis fici W106-1]|uniref:Protein kinase domain-containing protein n=1 Tax=Pestalotiopsis fici (strain W106-1 / CGMCC3.15140) TaxID=1229662 RepID=W3WZS0_PESFW|nr:uncharacterized protein PFICI_10694 [Pestalotiopsis fici W106-1]ETS78632.1 hypothetical protein PFICI_10694 [Pestalotiopsis fici W106-1]
MDELQGRIDDLRFEYRNAAGEFFVPEAALFELLSEAEVRNLINIGDWEHHEREELAQGIMRGARKCLSILLLINASHRITGFFQHDSMQSSCPDDRLPYNEDSLRRALGPDSPQRLINRFLEMQWTFMTPMFKQHFISREFDRSMILPFMSERSVGSGSMGDAYLVKIHPQCHQLPILNHEVVRKELKQREGENVQSFMRELKNLSLLAHLNHPNIVKLHCSYVQDLPIKCYNLVFDVADGGTLAELLDGRHKGLGLDRHKLLLGFAGLASAIDAVHNFTSTKMDLQLTGCHHDLAPRNIFVHGDKLLLADFGLSTLRNPQEDSLTMFKDVRGSYVAPECQKSIDQKSIQTGRVSRPSDIWSFGCILSEALTYILRGPPGVEEFRTKRLVEVVEGLEWRRFHVGPEKPNPFIEEWLYQLGSEEKGENWVSRVIDLIRWTLIMDPGRRPTSSQILFTMSGIATLALSAALEKLWDSSHATKTNNSHSVLEKFRFESWVFALTMFLDQHDTQTPGILQLDFGLITNVLRDIHLALLDLHNDDDPFSGHQLRILRSHNTTLIQALPLRYGTVFRHHLVEQSMQISSMEKLDSMSSAMREGDEHDIGALLAVRRLTVLADEGKLTHRSDLIINNTLATQSKLGIHGLARLDGESEDVIIEWLKYDPSWADDIIGHQLRNRLSTMASLLNDETTSALPGTLHCRGFFHAPELTSFGLVYRIPAHENTPRTLYELLEARRPEPGDKKSSERFRPPLEYRFHIASKLCRCVYNLHEIRWLHRNIHSMNVICFQPKGARDAEAAQDPRLLGLGASREDSRNSFTQGYDDDAQLRNYHHPRYLAQERYCAEFDYYSLGMVLLEVGLWASLAKVAQNLPGADDIQFRKAIVDKYVPRLDLTMGTAYMRAVQWCLTCYEESPSVDDGQRTRSDQFKTMVMERIAMIQGVDQA